MPHNLMNPLLDQYDKSLVLDYQVLTKSHLKLKIETFLT